MKKEIYQEIEIPEGVEIKLEEGMLIVKGVVGENKRKFNFGKLDFEVKEKSIRMGHKKATKKEKKMINTITSHIRNMIKGVQNKFEYALKICFSHFPFTLKVEGTRAIIKNFLGEKIDRITTIPEGAEIKIEKEKIIITSIDKELAGQAAANLEIATKVRNKDKRIFQDGIYITEKDGKKI